MKKHLTTLFLSALLWSLTAISFGIGWLIYILAFDHTIPLWSFIPATCIAAVGSSPALAVFFLTLPKIQKKQTSDSKKYQQLFITALLIAFGYALLGSAIYYAFDEGQPPGILICFAGITVGLFICASIAILLLQRKLTNYFNKNLSTTQNQIKMETSQSTTEKNNQATGNSILYKGIITGVLILAMLIPTFLISSLIAEREQRQKEIVTEVSSKWAGAQNLSGPYLFVPYKETVTNKDGKQEILTQSFIILPENLNVIGNILPEIRPRSIYKVLLYKSQLKNSGNFIVNIPAHVSPANISWNEIKICFGLSDYKGIEEKIAINFNGSELELSPGLPTSEIDKKGLSATVALSPEMLTRKIDFAMQLKLKGSAQLHFVPLSGNSSFSLQSTWPNPSFDGNNLPAERTVDEKGFTAKWTFNKANLPFNTILENTDIDNKDLAFGVTMLQTADQYAKTSRSVKYAILIIGLTFGLFFIIELMQHKPIHPVQYILVGIALIIFYTLLLSISEFIFFDFAYIIAVTATVILITLYTYSHFKSWKTATIFGTALSALYSFIFVLIRLEDTALLIGSIGLFIVLAMVMYASRKINWYGNTTQENKTALQ